MVAWTRPSLHTTSIGQSDCANNDDYCFDSVREMLRITLEKKCMGLYGSVESIFEKRIESLNGTVCKMIGNSTKDILRNSRQDVIIF